MSAQLTNLKEKLGLITGASSGIGRATAHTLATLGCDLILVGRRQERLSETMRELTEAHGVNVSTLSLDVSDRAACERAYQADRECWNRIDILVNNAGLALGTEPFQLASLDNVERMIDVNIKGLLFMTRMIASGMAERKTGHIVNIGSVAGRWTYPGGAVYCATKFAVRALTEGLRMDLKGLGVRVTNMSPGMVETEFSEVRLKDREQAAKVYEGMTPLSPGDVADAIAWCLTRPAHVNVQEMLLFPTDQPAVGQVVRRT